jgi:hypothetical protein
VTERGQAAGVGESGEATEPATRDVLEEDAFDRILGAEDEDLVERRIDGDHVHDHPTG